MYYNKTYILYKQCIIYKTYILYKHSEGRKLRSVFDVETGYATLKAVMRR